MIEITLLQNLRTLKSDFCSTGQTRRKRYKSGKILPEIQYCISVRCIDDLLYRQSFFYQHRKTQTIHQVFFNQIFCALITGRINNDLDLLFRIIFILPKQFVIYFTVIDTAVLNAGSAICPGIICQYGFFCTILIFQMQLCNSGHTITVVLFL